MFIPSNDIMLIKRDTDHIIMIVVVNVNAEDKYRQYNDSCVPTMISNIHT